MDLLMQWHGGGGTGVYSVGSRLFAGCEVAYDDEHVARALKELNGDLLSDCTDADQAKELEELIGWLFERQDLLAHRQSGFVHIYIECKEPDAARPGVYWYACLLRCEARPGELVEWKTTISEPMCSDVAVDSDEAYDRVARAALSFATCGEVGDEWPDETEQQAFGDQLEYAGDGYQILRPDEKEPEICQTQFDEMLWKIEGEMTAEERSALPGYYEIISEELNNEVLKRLRDD